MFRPMCHATTHASKFSISMEKAIITKSRGVGRKRETMTDAAMEEEIVARDDDAEVSIPPENAFVDHPPPPPISEDDSASATDVDDDVVDDDDDEAVNGRRGDDGEDDDDDDEDGEVGGGDDDVPPSSSSSSSSSSSDPTNALLSAMSHKDIGNGHFKSGNYPDAVRSYRRGTNALKNLNINNCGDEQVKSILITLQTNLSMVTYKQEKYKMSRDVASKAIDIDGTNVKALYRRAMAHRMLGDIDSARDDLRAALGIEPNNVAVRKELVLIKKVLDERKAKEKAGLQRAFSSRGASSLYSDKEEEEKRKEMERKEKDRLEKEAMEGRKKEWEDECVRRMAR